MAAQVKKTRKRREKKNIERGAVHIRSTFNNTIVTITDEKGNVISWASAGELGFKGSRKSTPFAAGEAALTAANQVLEADKAKLAKQNEELNAEVVELRNRPVKAALEEVGPASVYFEIGQTTLSQKELQHLDFYLKNVLPNVGDKKVAVITGSADSKTGTVRRNKYLSQKRVDYVMNILAEKYGIEADRFQVRTQIAKEGDAALNRAVIISFE